MEAAVIAAFVAAGAAIFTGVITAITNLRLANNSFKQPITRNILEEQYLKVISPIHEILSDKKGEEKDKIMQIEKILHENYPILPDEFLEEFDRYAQTKDDELFYNLISESVGISKLKLGYTQIKPKRYNRKLSRILGNDSKEINLFPWWVLIAFGVTILGLICVMAFVLTPETMNKVIEELLNDRIFESLIWILFGVVLATIYTFKRKGN